MVLLPYYYSIISFLKKVLLRSLKSTTIIKLGNKQNYNALLYCGYKFISTINSSLPLPL